jgi:hypothetical protein
MRKCPVCGGNLSGRGKGNCISCSKRNGSGKKTSKCKHADMCWQGGECQSEAECSLFECYYCPYSECGVCTGLTARQKRYVGNFICSACRTVATDNAVVLSASSLE